MAKRKPAGGQVIDGHATVVGGDPSPRVEVLTEQAQKAIVPWATGGKLEIQFHPTMQEIAQMKTEALEVVEAHVNAEGVIEDKDEYERIWKSYRAVIPLRTAVDDRRVEEGRQAREYVKLVNSLGNQVIEALKEVEAILKAPIDATDRKAEEEALAKAKAIEEQQRREEEERLAKLKAEEDARKAAEQAELQRQRDEIEAQRKKLQEEQEAARLEQQRKIEAERQEFERKKQEWEAQQAEQREKDRIAREAVEKRQRELDEENRRIENAKLEERRRQEAAEQEEKRKAQEAKAAEERRQAEERHQQQLKEAREQAAREAVEKAERDRLDKLRQEEEERKRQEVIAAEKAARAPDKVKLRAYVEAIAKADVCPSLKTKAANEKLQDCRRLVAQGVSVIEMFCED